MNIYTAIHQLEIANHVLPLTTEADLEDKTIKDVRDYLKWLRRLSRCAGSFVPVTQDLTIG